MIITIKFFFNNLKSVLFLKNLLKILIFLKFINFNNLKTQNKLKFIKRFVVLKSPHVNKKSKEKFYYIKFVYSITFFVLYVKKLLYIIKLLQIKLLTNIKIHIKFLIFKDKDIPNFFFKKSLKLLDIVGENSFKTFK